MHRMFALALVLPVVACGGVDDDGESTLTVLAASSLTGTFEELAENFEAEHPGVDVRLAFDSSATLAEQAAQGAPADVLATADEATMASAVGAGVTAAEPVVFAQNQLVLVAPATNPAGVTGVEDLDRVDYVVCVDTAPCGKVAAALLDAHGITRPPVSFEVDVKAVLAKVTGDEADAGLVYDTDRVAAGNTVVGFDVPGAEEQRTTYVVAPLEQSTHPDLAQAWIDLLTSGAGLAVLDEAGFLSP